MPDYSSPLLDDFNRTGVVTPGLQRAIDIAKQTLGSQFQFQAQPAQTQPSAMPSLKPPGSTPPVPKLQMPGVSDRPTLMTPPNTEPSRMPLAPQSGADRPTLMTPPNAEPGAPPAPAPQLRPPSAHQQELARLTTGDTGKSGIDQIHNPWLRVLGKVGEIAESTFFPRAAMLTPGTQLHHNMLVRHQQGLVDFDQKQATDEATRTHLGAESNELNSVADKNRRPPIATNELEAWQAQNPGKPIEDFLKLKKDNAPERNETAFDVWRKQNPDKPVQEWLKASGEVKPNEWEEFKGDYAKRNPNASLEDTLRAFSNAKQPAQRTPQNEYEDFKTGYLQKHPQADAFEIARQYATAHQAPEHAPQAMMFQPDGKGGYTATVVHPGQTVGAGSVNASGLNSQNTLTSTTRSMAETAPKVLDLAGRIGQLIDQQSASLGPAASRWNEFMAGKVGAPNPEFTKLRTDVGLLQTALMRMHVGARGGEQMMQHFHDLIDVAKQSPENLKAALEEITAYAKEVQAAGHPQTGGGGNKPGEKPVNPKDPMGVL